MFQVERKDCFKWRGWTGMKVGKKTEVNATGGNNLIDRKTQGCKGPQKQGQKKLKHNTIIFYLHPLNDREGK